MSRGRGRCRGCNNGWRSTPPTLVLAESTESLALARLGSVAGESRLRQGQGSGRLWLRSGSGTGQTIVVVVAVAAVIESLV